MLTGRGVWLTAIMGVHVVVLHLRDQRIRTRRQVGTVAESSKFI